MGKSLCSACSRAFSRYALGPASVAAFAFLAGCSNGNYGSASVTSIKGDPAARIDFQLGIVVPEGAAVSAEVALKAVDGDSLPGSLTSDDPSILTITETLADANDFVFLGVRSGSTHVRVTTNGEVVATVVAEVTAPAAGSVEELPAAFGTTPEPDGGADGGAGGSADGGATDGAATDGGDEGG